MPRPPVTHERSMRRWSDCFPPTRRPPSLPSVEYLFRRAGGEGLMREQPNFHLESFFIEKRGRAIALAKAIGGAQIDAEDAASAAWLGFVGKALAAEIQK